MYFPGVSLGLGLRLHGQPIIAYYTSDPLWDGNGCHHANNNHRSNSDNPWFLQQFASPIYDYLN